MGLREQLQIDLKQAMRAKDQARLTAIRTLMAAIKNEEVARRGTARKRFAQERGVKVEDINVGDLPADTELSDADIRQVISREIKKRQESVEIYRQAGRVDAANAEEVEIAFLQSYLPQQLSAEELRPMVQAIVDEAGATSRAELGKVMPLVMSRLKDRADGRLLNQIVRDILQ
jgi:uncharacterized protein YqeY